VDVAVKDITVVGQSVNKNRRNIKMSNLSQNRIKKINKMSEEQIDKIVEDFYVHEHFAPLQRDYLNDKRYYQLYGGRGSGKSFAAAMAVVEWTYSEFKHKILCLRQTMTSIEDSTISDIRTAIRLLGAEADFKEKKGLITNKVTGSTISFKGIKSSGGTHTAKLKSLSGITILVIEEAEEVPSFAEFSKIDESIRLKGKPLKVILIYNPTSSVSSWIHKEWFIDGQPNPERFKDTVYMHSTYLDNLENLAESVIQRYEDLKFSNPTYYEQTILAKWTLEVEGRVYAGWGQYEKFLDVGEVWYGLDFGYGGVKGDKTSLVKINYFEGVYYVTEMFSRNDLSISDTRQLMIDMGIPKDAQIYADSAVPTLLTELRKDNGFSALRKCRKGNVDQAIKKMQDKHIVMVGKNPNLFYSYMTFKRNDKGKIPHEPDELAALRYGILSKRPKRNLPTTRRKAHIDRVRQRKGSFL
jgi:phage terminase large subunit